MLCFGTQLPKSHWPLSFSAPESQRFKPQRLQDTNATKSHTLAFHVQVRAELNGGGQSVPKSKIARGWPLGNHFWRHGVRGGPNVPRGGGSETVSWEGLLVRLPPPPPLRFWGGFPGWGTKSQPKVLLHKVFPYAPSEHPNPERPAQIPANPCHSLFKTHLKSTLHKVFVCDIPGPSCFLPLTTHV